MHNIRRDINLLKRWSICVTLAYEKYPFNVHLVLYVCSFIVCLLIFSFVLGLHTVDEYSSCRRTRALYTTSFNAEFCDPMFLFRKLRDRLAEVFMF